MQIPKDVTDFPDYLSEMGKATAFNNMAVKMNFIARFFPKTIMDISIGDLSLKRYIIMREDDHPIFLERFTFADCIHFLYELKNYKYFRRSAFMRTIREYFIAYRVLKYLKKKYPKENPIDKCAEIVSEYYDTIFDNLPAKHAFVDGMKPVEKTGVESYSDYYLASIMAAMAKNYGWSEEYMLSMPVQVFWGYYHILRSDLNPDYKRETGADYIHKKYSAALIKIRAALEEKK